MTVHRAFLSFAFAVAASTASAAVSGRVISSDGKPVAGATVTAYAQETVETRAQRIMAGEDRRALATAKSGADGSFLLSADEAFVAVGARADGFAPAMVRAGPGESPSLKLKPAVTRRGTVTASGRPVADATVAWLASWQDPQSAELLVHGAKDGAYEVPDPDRWASGVAIVHRDFGLLLTTPDAKWGTSLSQELTSGVSIQGQVIDEKSGRGVAGATLWVDGWPRAKSSADGTFTIPHAESAWKHLVARTDAVVGTLKAGAARQVVNAQPARRLSGSVRDANTKQPLAGALVVGMDNSRGMMATAITDALGEYTLPALPSGRYWAYATRPGFAPGDNGEGSREPVDLRKSLLARRDLDLAAMRRVTGRVQDERAKPVEGALVSLGFEGMGTLYGDFAAFAGEEFGIASSESASLTAADGTFVLTVPPYVAGSFVVGGLQTSVLVLKQGYAAGRAKIEPASGAGAVVITLPRGMRVKGRVTGPDGTPLGDVGISVAESGPFFSFQSLASLADPDVATWATTNPDGSFSLQMQPVLHQLFFRKRGHAPKLIDSFDPRAGQNLDVVLDPAAEIRGRVVRADGRGVAGAALSLQDQSKTPAGTAVSEADGSFSIADLAAGSYELQIAQMELGIHASRRVEAPVSDLRVELGPTITVRGRVFDAATRAPVPRFAVMLAPASSRLEEDDAFGGRNQEFDTPEGTLLLEDVLVGGSILIVSAEGYRAKTIEGVAVSADAGNPELEVALEAGVTIRGRVTTTDGEAVPDAQVSAGERRDRQGAAETDENGDYELKGVASGEVRIEVAKQGFRSVHRTVQASQSTRLDVSLSRGLSLIGVVLYDDAGVPNANVFASSSVADADSQNAVTDANGRFTLHGLAPGRYNVSANAGDKGKAEVHDIDAVNAGSLRLVIDRSATAVLVGTVVGLGEGRERPPVVMVQVQDADGHSAHGIAQMSGAFRIEDAPAGRVTVSAQAVTPTGSSRTSQRNELTLAAGSESTTVIEFRDDVIVSGTVTRAGEGMRDINVSFRSGEEAGASSSTDHEGHYQVHVAPGPYRVSVEGSSVSYETDYVAVESGAFDIDVTGGALRGRAVEAGTAAPIPGVDVSLWPMGVNENHPVTSLQTGAQGAFEAPVLREGRYRVVTAKKGYGQQVREVELARGTTADVLFELQPADGVSVKVTDARDGRTLEAIVVVRDRAKRIVANQHAGTDADGAVLIPLADGPYLLSTSANGYGTATLSITAPGKGVQVGLTPGGTLVIESPRNLRGRIRLMQPDGDEYIRCWCNGIADIKLEGRRTTVDHVSPGSYTIELVEGSETFSPRPVVLQEGQVATVTID